MREDIRNWEMVGIERKMRNMATIGVLRVPVWHDPDTLWMSENHTHTHTHREKERDGWPA